MYDYQNGYIERIKGVFQGRLSVDGINLGEVIGSFHFDSHRRSFLWLRRKPILEYNPNTHKFKKRVATPFFECYAFKSSQKNISFSGQFYFLHFTYDLVCCKDDVIKDRFNIYVVRSKEQPLIKSIQNKNRENGNVV